MHPCDASCFEHGSFEVGCLFFLAGLFGILLLGLAILGKYGVHLDMEDEATAIGFLRFGVEYDQSGASRLLRRIGWSCQKPERRAREQDVDAIEHWRQHDWRRIKKLAK